MAAGSGAMVLAGAAVVVEVVVVVVVAAVVVVVGGAVAGAEVGAPSLADEPVQFGEVSGLSHHWIPNQLIAHLEISIDLSTDLPIEFLLVHCIVVLGKLN